MDGENYDEGFDGDTGGDTGTIERDDSREDIRKIVDRQKREKGIPRGRASSSNEEHGDADREPGFRESRHGDTWDALREVKERAEQQRQDEANRANYSEHFRGMEPYVREAIKNGTTPANAMRDYGNVETMWRRDPVQAIGYIAARTGIDVQRLAFAAHQAFNGPNGGQALASVNNLAQQHHHEAQIEVFAANPAVAEDMRPGSPVRMEMARLSQADPRLTLQQLHPMARANVQKTGRRRSRAGKGV